MQSPHNQQADKEFLTPAEVAKILKIDPHALRMQARADATGLGFPVIIIGTRLLIPRRPFYQYIGRS